MPLCAKRFGPSFAQHVSAGAVVQEDESITASIPQASRNEDRCYGSRPGASRFERWVSGPVIYFCLRHASDTARCIDFRLLSYILWENNRICARVFSRKLQESADSAAGPDRKLDTLTFCFLLEIRRWIKIIFMAVTPMAPSGDDR